MDVEFQKHIDAFQERFKDVEFVIDAESNKVDIEIPGVEETVTIDELGALVTFIANVRELNIDADLAFVRTRGITFRLIAPESIPAQLVTQIAPKEFLISETEEFEISFVPRDLLITLMAVENGAYNEDWLSPDSYSAIRIKYSYAETVLNPEAEEKMIEAVLFELAASEGLVFTKSALNNDTDFNPFENEESEPFNPKFRPLESFNEGIRLFNAAVLVDEPELRFLSLYKVIEYLGPVVFKLDRNEALRKRLDCAEALRPDGAFLDGLAKLAESMKEKGGDNLIPRIVLTRCVDFAHLSSVLPPSLKKAIGEAKDTEARIRSVAEAMYATRNSVAHAKSNYQKSGLEVPGPELIELNAFAQAVAVHAIRWYNRLPEHQRMLGA